MEEGKGTEEEDRYGREGKEETVQSGSHRYRNISLPEGLKADS